MAIEHTPRLGIETWSHGTDRHPPREIWDAQQKTLDDLVAIDRQYATLADRPAAGVRGTYCWVEENTTLYRDDGSQWRPVVQFGGGAAPAIVTGGSGSEGSSARSARADHSHPLPLATQSAHGGMSSTDKAKLDAATGTATANTLVSRDSSGRSYFSSVGLSSQPVNLTDAARKGYVDSLVGSVHVPVTIPSSANLNSYTTSGVYVQNQHNGATSGTNYPTGSAGLLEVHVTGTFVFQRYTVSRLASGTDADTVYRRTRYGNEWGPWQQSARAAYVDEQAGLARFAGHLDGVDLDDVLDPGLYGLNAQANATTALNYPAEGIGGTLLVMRWAGASGDSRAVTQLYQGRGATARNIVWIRSKIAAGSSWSQWVQLANTDLATASAAGLMPAADKALVDAATANATGSTLARRDSSGRMSVGTPEITAHAAPKGYVDGKATAAQSAAEATAAAALSPVKALTDAATASATANTLVRRDSAGRFKSATPSATTDVANKAYVDAVDSKYSSTKSDVDAATHSGTANTLVKRDSTSRVAFNSVAINNDPSNPSDGTRKSYVDAGDSALDARLITAETDLSNATDAAISRRLARRDNGGGLKVTDPIGEYGVVNRRTLDRLLEPLTYNSGARYVTTSSPLPGVLSATVTAERVGNTVSVYMHDMNGSMTTTGSVFWSKMSSSLTLPSGFRPAAPAIQGRVRLGADGAFSAEAPGTYRETDGATFTFVTSEAPPASFTWGTAV